MTIRGRMSAALHRVANTLAMSPRRGGSGMRASTWDGASSDRLYEDWQAWTVSPEFETRYAFRQMRARARTMARNNPWIVGFLDELANNVVGAHGIMVIPMVQTLAGTLAKTTNTEIRRGFAEWCYPENASADGHDSFVELERQIVQTVAVDGECFIRRVIGADNPFGYTLQLIDADLVDELYNVAAGPGQNRIRMGIEIDKHNRPIAYHIYTRYAEDMSGEPYVRERIPADQICHLFVRWHRSNIPRGITWLAPVLTRIRHEGEYEINHLVASRSGAAKMAFILNKHPDAVNGYEPPKKGERSRVFEMEAGSIPELLPGQEVSTFDPTFPSIAYEQYVMAVLRAIARGLKVSYMTLTGDLRQANYGSQRAGLQPERDRWRGLQVWFATHGVRVFYRDWIDMATLKGAIAVDSRLGSDFYDVAFHGRGWKWIDPASDLKAAKMELDLGLNTRTRLNAERGYEYEATVDQLAIEEDYADAAGVDVSGNQMNGLNAASVSQQGQADEENQPPAKDDKESSGPGARRLTAVS